MSSRLLPFAFLLFLSPVICAGADTASPDYTVYLIPNTHGTIAGWLVNFDTERSYVVNNHIDHLDRIATDATHTVAMSEVPNVMAVMKFAPERMELMRRMLKERRVEFVNGFFLEPTVNLSGGEALAQMGVLGLKWYDEVWGFRPRFAWMIDVCAMHRQMAQIVGSLGLEALFFSRNSPMPRDAFWWVAPDGTRTLAMALGPGYAAGRALFITAEPLPDKQFEELATAFARAHEFAASPRAVLTVTGGGDYSLAPKRRTYPAEFLEEWARRYPKVAVKMATPGQYVDALKAEMSAGRVNLDEYRGDGAPSYNAFWMNMPEVKRDYRRAEHLLAAGEMMATAASLVKDRPYPAQDFYHSWVQMLINMDRNVLWGAGSGSPFYDSHHWNAWDRFAWVTRQAGAVLDDGLAALTVPGDGVAVFNPLNWSRSDPVKLLLPRDRHPEGAACESVPGTDDALCLLAQPASGIADVPFAGGAAAAPREQTLPAEITTDYYAARFDAETGALISLRDRRSGKEYLGGPANVIQAESVAGVVKDPANWMAARPLRKPSDSTSQHKAAFQVLRGPVATTVIARSGFVGGSRVERRVTFYHRHPRIDFETTLDMRTQNLLVTADFPLAGTVVERTRGVPFGFSSTDPKEMKPPNAYFLGGDHQTYGFSLAIQPVVRWSDYALAGGGGVALLDRGLTCHELNGSTVTLALVNAQDFYRGLDNVMLTGQGVRTLEYALVPHTGDWREVAIPRRAWEFNTPVIKAEGRRAAASLLEGPMVTTSDNLIVEAVRRIEGDIEVRAAEWSGRPGEASVTVRLPHSDARLTNLMGEGSVQKLAGTAGTYRFPVRPQQIVTLRFRATGAPVPRAVAIRDWAPLVPRFKRAPLEVREPVSGYPAITRQPSTDDFGAKRRQ
jgi:alpha-mannosidase